MPIDFKAKPTIAYGTSDGSSEPVDTSGETVTFSGQTASTAQSSKAVKTSEGRYRGKKRRGKKGQPSGDSGALSPLGLAVGGAVAGGFLAAFTGYSPMLGGAAGAIVGGGYGYLRDGNLGIGGDSE